MAGGERLVPACFFGSKLQHGAHARRVPGRREVGEILIFRQQLQAIFQRIFSGCERQFVDEAFQANPGLQRIDGAHPAERHRSFGHHIFDGVVRDSVDRAGLVGQIGIDTVRNGLPFLSR